MNDENQLFTAIDSGIQTIIPAAALASPMAETASTQVVYLDFDGATTSYCNRELGITVENIAIEDSGFGETAIQFIVDALNHHYDNIFFTTDIPQEQEYSTIYVGKTDAFDEYGNFFGLAETIDVGNTIHNDNAFVFLDSTAATDTVISVIVHETDHIVSGMQHEGEGLEAFAAITSIASGVTSTGLIVSSGNSLIVNGTANNTTVNSDGRVYVFSGGTANSTTVNSNGRVYVFSGGTANSTTVNSDGRVYVSSGGTANSTTVNRLGSVYVSSGGTANSATVNYFGDVVVCSGGTANNTIVNSGGILDVWAGGTALNVQLSSGGIISASVMGNQTILRGKNAEGEDYYISNGVGYNISGAPWVFSGGIANSTTINASCCAGVGESGVINYTTLNHIGAFLYVDGGIANYTIFSSGGGSGDVWRNS